jgi:RHS repeat-associated protein
LICAATIDCSLSASGTLITDEWFSYSARGEVTGASERTQNSGGYYYVSAAYWANGTLGTLGGNLGLPTLYYGAIDGSGVDGEGRVQQVTAGSGTSPLASGVAYNVASQPTGVTFGSGDSDGIGYDSNTGRQTGFLANVGGTNPLLSGTLGWNANGSLRTLALNYNGQAENCTYSHDDLSRVASVNCNSGSTWAQTFGYDAFGNVTKSGTGTWLPTYNQSTNRIQSIPGASVSYDANGNLLSDGAHNYTWDGNWGNPSAIDSVSLTYDALGRMVEQNRGGTYTQVVYSPSGAKLALMSGQTLTKAFVPLPGGGTAVYTGTGLAYYRHPDWLGTSRLATTPSQTVYAYTGYAPFGENYEGQGSTDLSFTGQNQDTVSGLDDFLYREYSPAQGRWTRPDPAGSAAVDPTNPQSWNRYAYVMNSPLANIDPLGWDTIQYYTWFGNCLYNTYYNYEDTLEDVGTVLADQGSYLFVGCINPGGVNVGGPTGGAAGVLQQAMQNAAVALGNRHCAEAVDNGTCIAASTLASNFAALTGTSDPAETESFGTMTTGNCDQFTVGGGTTSTVTLTTGTPPVAGFMSTITMNSNPRGLFMNPWLATVVAGVPGTGYSNQTFQTIELLHELGHGASMYGGLSAIVADANSAELSEQNTQTIEKACFPQGDFGGNQGPVPPPPTAVPAFQGGHRRHF